MHCPVCKDVSLTMSERQGIEIDYCPKCRGVWLDRGELDKIIERAAATDESRGSRSHPADDQQQYPYRRDERSHHDRGYYKKKRGGFLGELFDFD